MKCHNSSSDTFPYRNGVERRKYGEYTRPHRAYPLAKGRRSMRGKQILMTAAVALAVVVGYHTYMAKKAG